MDEATTGSMGISRAGLPEMCGAMDGGAQAAQDVSRRFLEGPAGLFHASKNQITLQKQHAPHRPQNPSGHPAPQDPPTAPGTTSHLHKDPHSPSQAHPQGSR